MQEQVLIQSFIAKKKKPRLPKPDWLKIKIGENEESLSLKRVENCPYKIEIWNVDPDISAEASDLPVCYKFLNDESGVSFELNPKSLADDKGNPVRGKDFCHMVVIEQDSIENFV